MSSFDTLFPVPSGGRNADDMGMPANWPPKFTMIANRMYLDDYPMWQLISQGSTPPGSYLVATPTDRDMPIVVARLYPDGLWAQGTVGREPLGFTPQWFGPLPMHPPYPPPDLLPEGHPWRVAAERDGKA